MASLATFLLRRREKSGWSWTDIAAYAYLALGVILILAPIIWLFASSLKSQRALTEADPRFLPWEQVQIVLPGENRQRSLFVHRGADGSERILAFVRSAGANMILVDPANPSAELTLPRRELRPHEEVQPRWRNYTGPTLEGGLFGTFPFLRYFWNSTFVTVVATALTLIVSSMAAFGLSKYRFRGRSVFMVMIVMTLLLPASVILVPLFVVVRSFGMLDSLWGVIIPAAATPTGIFLLRQYMLTIPDELIEAARMDSASEWTIFVRIILPLALPALAVLAILSVIWRWNDFLWPLIVLTRSESFTLQIGLSSFKGEQNENIHELLAMTVLTLIPVTFVFTFLQKYITTGIANTGLK